VPLDVPSVSGNNQQTKRKTSPAGLRFRDDYLSVPLTIIWEVTHACNLDCLHCLSACGQKFPGELTTDEAIHLIDTLAELNIFSITLGGGEPLVREDIFDLIKHCTDKNLCVRLSTNGYNVTAGTIGRLKNLNVFAVQVSIDGLRESHDYLRNRKGAFERAIEALRLFRNAGCHTFMTVTAKPGTLWIFPLCLIWQ
jgi:MoaA/NifB/PqqE/SkfB family radical SAM enzyme